MIDGHKRHPSDCVHGLTTCACSVARERLCNLTELFLRRSTSPRDTSPAVNFLIPGEDRLHGKLSEIAQRIGAPKSVRAVARACAINPLGVIVPCHRVIGSSGALVGYGGGLDRKQWLLDHEAALLGHGKKASVFKQKSASLVTMK